MDGDALRFVTISSIPSHGLLLLNGKAVIANQQISKAELGRWPFNLHAKSTMKMGPTMRNLRLLRMTVNKTLSVSK
ncbi:hypothetical protein O9929_26400 [Vibrio lentus]|nr:hypothetical protein [Vibrio lentus]